MAEKDRRPFGAPITETATEPGAYAPGYMPSPLRGWLHCSVSSADGYGVRVRVGARAADKALHWSVTYDRDPLTPELQSLEGC